MMSNKGIAGLVAAVVIAVAAAIVSQRQVSVDGSAASGAMFPELMAKANGVAKVMIKKPGETVTLVRRDQAWVVEEKGGYPALTARVRQLVLGLAQLQRVEAKTKNPQRYARLGLAGLDEADSTSTLVQLLDATDNTIGAVILGKRQASPADPGRMAYYVRAADDPQSWLVEGSLPETGSTVDWLDKSLLELSDERVRSVTVHHPDGEILRLSRKDRSVPDFAILDLTPEEEIESQYALNSVANTFARLAMDDVERDGGAASPSDGITRVILETFDGVRVAATLIKDGEQVKARLAAEYDETLVEKSAPAVGESDAAAELSPQQDVERWSEQWRNWVYVIPDYQFESIGVKKADLLNQSRDTAAAEKDQPSSSQN